MKIRYLHPTHKALTKNECFFMLYTEIICTVNKVCVCLYRTINNKKNDTSM